MPRQNCNSMAVFAVTVYSVFTKNSQLYALHYIIHIENGVSNRLSENITIKGRRGCEDEELRY